MQIPTTYPAPVSLAEGLTELTVHLRSRLAGRVRDLGLDLRGQGLVLRGWAATYHAKQLAQHALMRLATLPIVANEIAVCRPRSEMQTQQSEVATPART
jgi:hypothetical protein